MVERIFELARDLTDTSRENKDVLTITGGIRDVLGITDITDNRTGLEALDVHDGLVRTRSRDHNVSFLDRIAIVEARTDLGLSGLRDLLFDPAETLPRPACDRDLTDLIG